MDDTKKSDNKLTNAVRALFELHVAPGDTAVIALSGGMDSIAMLDAAVPLQKKWRIAACHVNHGISPRADAWESFCREQCDSHGVQFFSRRATATDDVSENWARKVRMDAFAELPVRAVVAAHHADDQAETVLFRMLRGTGAHGMSAMRACAPLPGAPHLLLLRPWLDVPRAEIVEYVRHRKLRWVEDEDNRNVARRRNFLRHRVMPVLREYFPDSGKTVSVAASRFGMASRLLAELADEDEHRARDGEGLDLEYFRAVGTVRLQNWLHVRLSRESAKFGERGLAEAARQIMNCRGELALDFAGRTLRIWRQRLYMDAPSSPPDFFSLPLDMERERQNLPQVGGALILRRIIGDGLSGRKITGGVVAQLRRGGERLRVSAHRARAVSDMLREADIAPWHRCRLPLLFVGEAVAAVPGVAVAADFRAETGESGIECRMEWH